MSDVEIIRSKRRKKTVQAREVDGRIYVYLPEGLSKEEEKRYVDELVEKVEKRKRRQKLNDDGSLTRRAQELNEKYFDGKLEFRIKYVTNQSSKSGSCTPATKTIRISDRVANMPPWVRDYVIIHELAHLVQPNHSREFWKLVNRYRYAERARGYLIAVGMGEDERA
ncbi:MAG: M48 family metallopeptidase [Thermoplasmata archaeon]|nr:M48 family metallopeptidase [Thermoplasmata archaeon]